MNPSSPPDGSASGKPVPASAAFLLEELNASYLGVHRDKEDAFWAEKMALSGAPKGAYAEKEIRFQQYVSDPASIPRIREELLRADLPESVRVGLSGWLRFFEVHAIESAEAQRLRDRIVEMEGELARRRQGMGLGYFDPATGEKIPASSVRLGLLLRTAPEEGLRRAAHAALGTIEKTVLEQGFIDIVKERNRLGRLLGYEDYYDYKVSRNEGFSKKKLFEILGDLERRTRTLAQTGVEGVRRHLGDTALEAHNFIYHISGDLTARMDPYFDFGDSLLRWGRSFSALGIRYRGCRLSLDLLDRAGKYENGFMHGPDPAFEDEKGFHPARINFTANAIPGQVGSGHRALETLLHEGGHAAHFSNIRMPAPCFSQEYAPTSVAFAETQSMFLDSFIEDPDWLARYARNAAGEAMPESLALESIRQKHPHKAFQIRSMLSVCLAEKALYEMPDRDLEPERILKTFRGIEREMQFLRAGTRPVLSVPHLLSGESSAYYHGYVLAEMAVLQTRRFFRRRDGFLVDNPRVGEDLARHYWEPGNSKTFLELVEGLTGEAFSADALVEDASSPLEERLEEARLAFRKEKDRPASATGGKTWPPCELEAEISIVDGDTLIAETSGGRSFEEAAEAFRAWIAKAPLAS